MGNYSLSPETTTVGRGYGGGAGYKGKLIRKMKLLPYMVRTFVCRNGLRILKDSGLGCFNAYAQRQFTRWEMSETAAYQWMPFFTSWGLYCESQLWNTSTTAPSTISSYDGSILPPLTSTWYIYTIIIISRRVIQMESAPKSNDMTSNYIIVPWNCDGCVGGEQKGVERFGSGYFERVRFLRG